MYSILFPKASNHVYKGKNITIAGVLLAHGTSFVLEPLKDGYTLKTPKGSVVVNHVMARSIKSRSTEC